MVVQNRISRYQVVRRLGAGGMGEVFLAQDPELERTVALKVMSEELARDPEKRKRFRTEAKAASGLSHPNICVVHEVGETADGRPFLAMEYIEGMGLDRLLQERRLKLREVINVGIGVAEALEVAHARGIIHRDIKPANIILTRQGSVKVLDFGLAKRVATDSLSALEDTSTTRTRTGMLIGTPHYMSPEQVLGREVDIRTDLFSLGAVLYEAVAGQKPFRGLTVGEVINNVVNQQPEPLGLENPVFSPELDRIIFKCLEKDPATRYASAAALAADLQRLKTESDLSLSQEMRKPVSSLGARGEKLNAPASSSSSGTRWLPAASVVLAAASVVLLCGLIWIGFRYLPQTSTADLRRTAVEPVPKKSVAVLPFDNFSPEADTEYLSDGLTEEITTALSRIPGLKVAARNSAFAFKGKKEDARKVGQALRVATLLEGSVRKSGTEIRVTAQLINVADGFHLWAETYENRSVNDIISVQEDIARKIAARLEGQTNQLARRSRAPDPEAFKLYLQARLQWNKRTEAGLKRAVQLFNTALEKDPTYAAGYAGLAATYLVMPEYVFGARPSAYRPLARASANRALDLDSGCAEAHAVLGSLEEWSGNYAPAEEHFRQAIELDPNYATARHWFGQFLSLRGRRTEGLAQIKNAIELDPLSPVIHATIPAWYYMARAYPQAVQEARKVIAQFPDFPRVRYILIAALESQGQFEEALKEIESARALQPDEPLALLDLRAFCLARLGRESEAREILATFEQAKRNGQVVWEPLSRIYVGLRDYDKVIDILETIQAEEGLDPLLPCDPALDELRKLPRFKALLEKAGLTDSMG